MRYNVEKSWITAAGLRAVVIMSVGRSEDHRCGYVAVTEGHPAFGKRYDEQLDCISQDAVNNSTLGDKSPILAFTAGCGSDDEHNLVRRSLDILLEVHGGLTYSSHEVGSEYPIPSEGLWWFGFDCAHYNDIPSIGGRTLEFCEEQCESLARQLVELAVSVANKE